MRSLARSLQDRDLGHLRIVAELWGLDPPPGEARQAAEALARSMLEPDLMREVLEALPEPLRTAVSYLVERQGRAPIAELSLRFGPMTPTGPGRRDREKPWRHPEAVLDGLWYRGLLALGYVETPTGIQEFGYLPDEVRQALAPDSVPTPVLSPSEPPAVGVPHGAAADDATTLLAALRRRPVRSDRLTGAAADRLTRFFFHPASLSLLLDLLMNLGAIVPGPLRTDPAKARALLAQPRSEVTARLLQAWRTAVHNDLADVPGLTASRGRWPNDPQTSRAALLTLLEGLSPGTWYSIEAFVAWTRDHSPTFLRPGGDFESWYLQDPASGRFLRGVEEWESVEGGLLRHVLTGPLHWLGAVDLGSEETHTRPTVFRLPREAPEAGEGEARPPARLFPDGRLVFGRGSALPERYQIARFAEWIGRDATGYLYRITPRALTAAATQRLEAGKVMAILEKATRRPVPESLRRAIERWSKAGAEASLEAMIVLRLRSPSVLERLQAHQTTARYLQEVLGPTSARVRVRDVEALVAAAARRGLLIDPPTAGSEGDV